LERELRMGIVEPGSMKLRDFMKDSLARTGDQIRESTRIDYEHSMNELIDLVGNIDYQNVQQTQGELFRQACLDMGNSPATVAKKLRELKRFFQLAVERKQLEENPFRYVKLPKSPKKKIRIYTEDESERILRAASEIQNESILEWDLAITLVLTTAMRKSELLNLTWNDIDFDEQTVGVNPKKNTDETWKWQIKDTDCRTLPLKDDVVLLLVNLQNRSPEGCPYVLVPPERYDHIQSLREKGNWTFCNARNKIVNNFNDQFNKILKRANIKKGTFHDIRRTAITNWFRQGLSEYDVITLAGHANFATTHKFYLAAADDLIGRARQATTHQVSQKLLQKCCSSSFRGSNDKDCQTQVLDSPRVTQRGRRDSNPQPSDRQSDALSN